MKENLLKQSDFTVFLMTVGESITFKALDLIKAHTKVDYDLVVWYDACGRGVNMPFYTQLLNYTDDVILVRKNKGITAAQNFAAMSLRTNYLVIACADNLVKEGYLGRLIDPFLLIPNMAVSGESYREFKEDFVISDPDRGPDLVQMISHEAIEALGGFCNAFPIYGYDTLEFQRRAMKNGWHTAAVKNICEHGGDQHEGRNLIEDYDKIMDHNGKQFTEAIKRNYAYNWWTKNIIGTDTVDAPIQKTVPLLNKS